MSYDLTHAAHDYPAWQGPPTRTLLLCTHPRSGSSLLGEALYFAGGLGCPLEYFHTGFRPGLAARWGTTTLADHVRAAHRWRTDPGGTFAVKLFWRDIEEIAGERAPGRFVGLDTMPPADVPPDTYRAIAATLADIFPNPRFVYLERRDRVRLAVSGVAAMQTGLWRQIATADPPAPSRPLTYDRDRIERYIAAVDTCHAHWRNFFAAIGAVPHALTYEALSHDYHATIAGTLAWLGRDAAVPPARLQRQAAAAEEALVLRYMRDRAATARHGPATDPSPPRTITARAAPAPAAR